MNKRQERQLEYKEVHFLDSGGDSSALKNGWNWKRPYLGAIFGGLNSTIETFTCCVMRNRGKFFFLETVIEPPIFFKPPTPGLFSSYGFESPASNRVSGYGTGARPSVAGRRSNKCARALIASPQLPLRHHRLFTITTRARVGTDA